MENKLRDFKVNSLPNKGVPNSRYYVPIQNSNFVEEYITDKNGTYKKVSIGVADSDGTISWNDIDDIPTEFYPEPHIHSISEIYGLQQALDNSGSNIATNYVHLQSQSAKTWTINHNLNFYPNVTVVNSAGDKMLVDVHYDSVNKVTINFIAANGGTAYLS